MGRPQRHVFGEALAELGAEDERVVVLDADVSSSTQTRHFAAEFPERFFNFGVAEANMLSAAAGFAACGHVPFVSTFAFLMTLRAGDQVRAQVAQPRLNVKLVGGYAGLSDYADGASHQSVEDLAVMRAMPNVTVIVPGNVEHTKRAVRAAARAEGPLYLRLSRAEVTDGYGVEYPFEVGRGVVVRPGDDLTIIAAGPMVAMALEAADGLAGSGLEARVVDMHTLKPLDRELLIRCAEDTGAIVTVEEHSVNGGLGGAVCEAVSAEHPVPVLRCGFADRFGESGAYEEILRRAGLSANRILELARKAVDRK